MPWEKQYDETAVLERAMLAFWARGYQATSMAELVAATGVNRGSLYAAYPGKRELFLAVLRHYDKLHRIEPLAALAEQHSPRSAILEAFSMVAQRSTDKTQPGGCLLVNSALEMSPHDAEIAAFIDRSMREVERFFRQRIEAAQREGELGMQLDANATAKTLLSLFLGLRVLTRANQRQSTIYAVLSQVRTMLE